MLLLQYTVTIYQMLLLQYTVTIAFGTVLSNFRILLCFTYNPIMSTGGRLESWQSWEPSMVRLFYQG